MTAIALVIIVAHRWTTVATVTLPSALDQGFDEIVTIGLGEDGAGYRNIRVAPFTATTLDALILRDVAAAATTADVLVYLSDDHMLHHHFGAALRYYMEHVSADVLIPRRYTVRDQCGIDLPMGWQQGYCAGHGMVIRRPWVQRVPWTSAPHHPNWDVFHSRMLLDAGCQMLAVEHGDLAISDVEYLTNPESQPWV